MNKTNIAKFFYERAVNLLSNLKAYEERTNKYVEAFKNYINNAQTILDAGCGSGEFARKLAKKGNTITVLDIQKQYLTEIKEENIYKICVDACNLPLRENSIDYVLSH
jgi:ubiquinone/menaquinone biosynthesis C-methylase UbiE